MVHFLDAALHVEMTTDYKALIDILTIISRSAAMRPPSKEWFYPPASRPHRFFEHSAAHIFTDSALGPTTPGNAAVRCVREEYDKWGAFGSLCYLLALLGLS